MQARNRSDKAGLLPALYVMLAAFLISTGSLLYPVTAFSLGLGELTLNSTLNEPLRASIALEDLDGLDLIDLTISIGSIDDYERAGLQRDTLLTDIDFEVSGSAGQGEVVLSSTRSINEPFLNLILIANWPSGRLIREYTILMDLPGSTVASTPPAGTAISASVPNPGAVNASPASDSYVVQTGDTLFQIAEQTRPDSNVSVQQMMIALQRANEDAFVNNNINRIITGRVLRIPPMQDIRLIDQEAANAQVNAQNQALAAQPLAGGASGGSSNGATQDELTLLSGDTEAGAGSSDLEATIAALENELMISEENLDRARLENEELTARLASLEEQIELLQNIIAIEDERLAQFQADLAAQAEAAARVAASAQATGESLDSPAPGQADSLVGQLTSALQSNLVSLAAVLVLVILILAFLVVRRRRAEAADTDDFDLDAFEEQVASSQVISLAETDTAESGDLETSDEAESVAGKAGLAGLFAGLMARFRKDSDEEDPDTQALDELHDEELDEALDEEEPDVEIVDTDAEDESLDTLGPPDDEYPVSGQMDDAGEDDAFDAVQQDDTDDTVADTDSEMPEFEIEEPGSDDDSAMEVGNDADNAPLADADDSPLTDDDELDALESALDEIESFEIDDTEEMAEMPSEEQETLEISIDEVDEVRDAVDSTESETNLTSGEAAESDIEEDVLSAALDAVDFDDLDDDTGADAESGSAKHPEQEAALPEMDSASEEEHEIDFSVTSNDTSAEADDQAGESGDDTEVFEFSLNEAEAPQEPATEAPDEEEEVETFAFSLSGEKPDQEQAVEETPDEEVEVISFDPVDQEDDTLAAGSEDDSGADESIDEIEEIAFDDTTLHGDDEEESVYTPRTNMDECDTKLDLAVAYEAMGDLEGAIEILEEVIADGNEKQVGQAEKLKTQWQGS